MVETAYLFCCRSLDRSLLSVGLFTNLPALAGAAGMILLQLFFTYSPVMNRLFGSVPLEPGAWADIAVVAVMSFVAVETEKWIRRWRSARSAVFPRAD